MPRFVFVYNIKSEINTLNFWLQSDESKEGSGLWLFFWGNVQYIPVLTTCIETTTFFSMK